MEARVIAAWSLVLLGFACATQAVALPARTQTWSGTITDVRTQRKLSEVDVVVCEHLATQSFTLNATSPSCEKEIARAATNDQGAYTLTLPQATAIAKVALIVRRLGYSDHVVRGDALRASSRTKRADVALSPAPRIEAHVRTSDGSPIHDAHWGWFTERDGALRVHGVACCLGPDGVITFSEGLDEMEVYVFAFEHAAPWRYALVRADLKAGETHFIALELAKTLNRVYGKVVASDGSPLTGLVHLDGIERKLSAFDRVLAQTGAQTDAAGNFELLVTTAGKARISLNAWSAGRGTRVQHVDERTLSTRDVSIAHDMAPIALEAPRERIVICQLVDGAQNALAIDELGLWFGPHLGWAHSDSCVYAGGAADPEGRRARPSTVSFVWPDGAETVRVSARSAPAADRVLVGDLVLEPDQPCRIEGRPE